MTLLELLLGGLVVVVVLDMPVCVDPGVTVEVMLVVVAVADAVGATLRTRMLLSVKQA